MPRAGIASIVVMAAPAGILAPAPVTPKRWKAYGVPRLRRDIWIRRCRIEINRRWAGVNRLRINVNRSIRGLVKRDAEANVISWMTGKCCRGHQGHQHQTVNQAFHDSSPLIFWPSNVFYSLYFNLLTRFLTSKTLAPIFYCRNTEKTVQNLGRNQGWLSLGTLPLQPRWWLL